MTRAGGIGYNEVWIRTHSAYFRKEAMQMQAIVAERGQVTIPKALRERLGITPKTVLDFHEEDGLSLRARGSGPGRKDEAMFDDTRTKREGITLASNGIVR